MNRRIQNPASLPVHSKGRNARNNSGLARIPGPAALSPANAAPFGHESGEDRLQSWKAIAAYVGREVRTVQRWERAEHLPVRRHLHSRNGSVYAFRSEIDEWRRSRSVTPELLPVTELPSNQPRPVRGTASRSHGDTTGNPSPGVRLYLLVCSSDADFYRVISRMRIGTAKT